MTRQQLAEMVALWHGQKLTHTNREEMQTVASSRGYGRWGDSSSRYAERHWQEYTSVADFIQALLDEQKAMLSPTAMTEWWSPFRLPDTTELRVATLESLGWI
jgi:hypothetical protein